MIIDTWALALGLIGGITIGLAVTLMLLFNGRVTGISGITYGLLTQKDKNWAWKAFFLVGLLTGGFVLRLFMPSSLENSLNYSDARLIIAGLLVGFGTLLGNGCTSGHGVCGISRFSLRSITATMTFMALGIMVVYLVNHLLGGH